MMSPLTLGSLVFAAISQAEGQPDTGLIGRLMIVSIGGFMGMKRNEYMSLRGKVSLADFARYIAARMTAYLLVCAGILALVGTLGGLAIAGFVVATAILFWEASSSRISAKRVISNTK